MEANKKLETVKRQIRALMAKSIDNGCTEAEAFQAMEKVSELLSVYNLSMTEVELRSEQMIEKKYQTVKTKTCSFYAWSGISRLCGVKIWRSQNYEGYVWSLFGLESDVAMAYYLFELIDKSGGTALNEFKATSTWMNYQGHRRTLTANFQNGFGDKVCSRLNQMWKENKEAEKKAQAYHAENSVGIEATDVAKMESARQTTGTALISVAKEKLIEEEFNKRFGYKLRKSGGGGGGRYNSEARAAGATAGSKVNLSRPVGGSSGKTSGYLN